MYYIVGLFWCVGVCPVVWKNKPFSFTLVQLSINCNSSNSVVMVDSVEIKAFQLSSAKAH